jgi:hypothetical protein
MNQNNGIIVDNQEDLSALENISKDIEEKTKELNNIFDSLEETFRKKLNIGVGAWCSKILSPMQNERYGYKFGYCRVDKCWRLVCRKVNLDNPNDDEDGYYGIITPINNMPRKVRIEASTLIPELIQKLKEKSLSFKNTISNAVVNLEDIERKIRES